MLTRRKIGSMLAMLALVVLSSANAAPLPEPRAVTVDETKWLLPDAEVFFKLNVKQIMRSDLMTKGGTDKLKEIIKNNSEAKAVLAAADIDVTKDVDTILASAIGSTPKDGKMLIVIRGKFNQTKIHDTLKKTAEKEGKLKLVKEGQTQLYQFDNQDKTMYAAFADKNTIVITQSKDSTVDAVKNGGKKVVTINKELKAAMDKFTGKESMAMALIVTDPMKKVLNLVPNAGKAAAKIKTVNASFTLSDAIVLNLAGFTGEADSAEQLAKLLKGFQALGSIMEELPPIVADVLNATKITASKEAVKVDLKLTKEMLDKAAKGGGN